MNDAIAHGGRSRSDRDREVVQRTAELLTSSLTLEDLFHALCSLLARFVDASSVFIALKDQQGARIAYVLQNGVHGALDNKRVRAGTITDTVLHSGKAVLKRRWEDWSEGRHALTLPGQPEQDDRVSAVFVPLKFGSHTIGVLSVQSAQTDAYDEADVDLLQTCALYLSVRIHQAQLETQSARLENIASTDSLTGVANRRSFNERFASEWRRSIRRAGNLALLLIDIDFFKAFNDTYGHVAGDAALQQVATALASCLSRSEDLFARYGGEEFVAILPETSLSGAVCIAERMRQTVFDLGIAHSGSLLQRLTVSAGVAWKIPVRGSSSEELLRAADTALYQAKRGGRNRVAAENYRSDAPPAYPSQAHQHNLPGLHGHTFGRSEHVQQVRKLLRVSRLLTLIGPAGVGKSRAAIEAAKRELARFPDGVYYVDCSTIGDDRYLGNKIGSVLGVNETPLVTRGAAAAEALRCRRALLILDNCDGVQRACAEYVRTLSGDAPDVRIIVTSREPTFTPGEVSYVVPPLAAADAAALFTDRAEAVANVNAPDAAAVQRICAKLEGLPRALQLAAAQLATMPLDQLERRLNDSAPVKADDFTRWSYEVLRDDERRLLRGMCVFAGGATGDAVAEICGDRSVLGDLIDKGLVAIEPQRGAHRYVISGSIRLAVAQRARELGEFDRRAAAHAAYYAKRARELEESYPTKHWQSALASMTAELDNLRAALIFTVSQGHDVQLGAELSCDLIHYWQQTGLAAAGREWLEELSGRTDIEFPGPVRAKMLYGLARLDTARSKRALDAALGAVDAYRELGDERGLAAALFEVAAALAGVGDTDSADAYLREGLEIGTRINDKRLTGDMLNGMAVAEQWRGHVQRARELLEESLRSFRELEDDRGVASLLGNLGDLAAMMGDYDRAVALTRQSLAILERLHDPQSTAWQLLNLGAFELKRRNADAARPAIRRSLELLREYRDDWLSANCVDCLARLAFAEREWARALQLAAFADSVFAALGVPRQPPDRVDYEFLMREAKVAIGLDAAQAAQAEGAAMEWADVMRIAVQA